MLEDNEKMDNTVVNSDNKINLLHYPGDKRKDIPVFGRPGEIQSRTESTYTAGADDPQVVENNYLESCASERDSDEVSGCLKVKFN